MTDRTGPSVEVMIANYNSATRTTAELDLRWFAPLDASIPELGHLAASEADRHLLDFSESLLVIGL